ncbi:hypothetical protein NE237_020422 [Protea cynaroides]|uniref:Uncharacterized protein n=1 Tax=Protea cynaroides TaxID=273540 RepID=A0A9Q0K2K3_9MAGN|nr:hypothetical protein NE237_020422 [Protea cynaroides]
MAVSKFLATSLVLSLLVLHLVEANQMVNELNQMVNELDSSKDNKIDCVGACSARCRIAPNKQTCEWAWLTERTAFTQDVGEPIRCRSLHQVKRSPQPFTVLDQALDKIRFLSLTEKEVLGEGDNTKLEILIKLDKEKKVLSIRDRAFVEKMQTSGDLNLIGQFGVGF